MISTVLAIVFWVTLFWVGAMALLIAIVGKGTALADRKAAEADAKRYEIPQMWLEDNSREQ